MNGNILEKKLKAKRKKKKKIVLGNILKLFD